LTASCSDCLSEPYSPGLVPIDVATDISPQNLSAIFVRDCQSLGPPYDHSAQQFPQEEIIMAKSTRKTRSSRSRDRKLVAGRQKHEVRYTAKKAGVKAKAVKKAIKRAGHSRTKVERVLSGVRKAVKRVAQAPKKVVQALSSTPEGNSTESSSSETKG
jgi:hypothetical protein